MLLLVRASRQHAPLASWVREAAPRELPATCVTSPVALVRWFDRRRERLLKAIRRQLSAGSLARAEEEDVLHESLLVVLTTRPPPLESAAGAERWLLAISRNVIRNGARRRRALVAVEQALRGAGQPIASRADAARESEELERLRVALGSIPREARAAIVAREVEGASWEQVASQLGRPSAEAARKYCARWRSRVRRVLGRRD